MHQDKEKEFQKVILKNTLLFLFLYFQILFCRF